jgi:hypothetical protein
MTIEIELHIGRQMTGFTVRPDATWPQMWRVHAPDGRVSDMANLSRALDAGVAWARPRGLGGGEKVHWYRREIDGIAPPMRRDDLPVLAIGIDAPETPGSAFPEMTGIAVMRKRPRRVSGAGPRFA